MWGSRLPVVQLTRMPSSALLAYIGQDALVRAAEWLSVARTITTRTTITRTTRTIIRTIDDIGESVRTVRSIESCTPGRLD